MGKDKKKSKEREQLENEVTEKLEEVEALTEVEDLVKDNKKEFEYKKETYRIRKPKYKERKKAEAVSSKKSMELLDSDAFTSLDRLKEKWLRKGVDIDKMEAKIEDLNNKLEEKELELAPLSSKPDKELDKDSKKLIENLKDKIKGIKLELTSLRMTKYDKLRNSIEYQLRDFTQNYLAYLVLEKKNKEEEWKRVFDSYEDFMDSDEDDLIILATNYFSIMSLRTFVFGGANA